MIELSLVRDMVAIFGVIAGLTYYYLTVQSQRKNQKLQSAYNIWNVYHDDQAYSRWLETMNLEWKDVDEFIEKYWRDPELQPRIGTIWQFYDGMGYMWKKGVLDISDQAPLYGSGCLFMWRKYKPVIEYMRDDFYCDWLLYWGMFADALEEKIGDQVH
jgi:hypothetical protein